MARLTKRLIESAKADPKKDVRLWDDDPRGFGLRIKSSGVKSFFYQFRSPETDSKRRITFAQYGELTLDEAREKAKELAREVRHDVDPLAKRRRDRASSKLKARTVREFCDVYLEDAKAGLVRYRGKPKKESTIEIDEGRINRHIKPLLGDKLIPEITKTDVENFMDAVQAGKTATVEKTKPRGKAVVTGGAGTAARTVGLLGSIFSYAVKKGLRMDNPVRGVEREESGQRTRYLNADEYKALGKAIQAADFNRHPKTPLLAVLALALTGCRKGEIFKLKKTAVDLQERCLRLEDTKTGQQIRPIGRAACEVLKDAMKLSKSDFVFPSIKGDGHLTDSKFFKRLCEKAELEDVTLHTLRHSFATVAVSERIGYSEIVVAGLLGHSSGSVTSRYMHVDQALVFAADKVSAEIKEQLEGRRSKGNKVVLLHA